MSKVRDLPQIETLADDDLLYAVDFSAGPNGGHKITKEDLKTSVAPTAEETKAAYESNPDTNAFTDAEKAKLLTIEAGAEFQNAEEVPYDNSDTGISATNVQEAIDEVIEEAQADFRPSIVSGRILHYSGGTARFDDVFYSLLPGDILLNPNITFGEVYVDLDGLVKQTASGITAPALSIVFAQFSTDLNNITALVDQRVKNTQNLVRGTLSDVRDVRAGAAAVAGTSGRLSDAMHKHNILTGAAATQLVSQGNAEGSSANLARADHIHNIPAAAPNDILKPSLGNTEGIGTNFSRNDHTHSISTALVADITTILPDAAASAGTADNYSRGDHHHAIATDIPVSQSPDQSNSEGASNSFSRADHVHNIPTEAPITPLSPATTNAEGVGSSFARNDHTHSIATALVADISTIDPDDAASAGSVDRFARGDHQHAIAAAAPTTNLSPATANAEGVGSSFARNDHTHAVSTALVADISSILPDDAAAAGTANTFARGDHKHAIATTAPTTTLSPATTNSEGVATSFTRGDHTHAIDTGLVGEITTIQPDATAAAGTVDKFARADHRHAIVADVPVSIGTANSEGAATSFARSDHVHDHGAQTTPTHHAAVTTTDNGFMSSTDKTKLDALLFGFLSYTHSAAQSTTQNNTAFTAITWDTDTGSLANSLLTKTSGTQFRTDYTGYVRIAYKIRAQNTSSNDVAWRVSVLRNGSEVAHTRSHGNGKTTAERYNSASGAFLLPTTNGDLYTIGFSNAEAATDTINIPINGPSVNVQALYRT